MTPQSSETLFRQAAEAEGGEPVSAGARVSHVRLAVDTGRAVHIDLSGVPVDRRPGVIAEIRDVVSRAGGTAVGVNP